VWQNGQTYFALGMCKPDQMSLYREELEVPFLEVRALLYVKKSEICRGLRARCFARTRRNFTRRWRMSCWPAFRLPSI